MIHMNEATHTPREQHHKVVVADDDAVILSMLVDKLKHAGYQVISARNGELALDLIKEHQPRVVVLDWIMPKLDGLSVCQQIKADPALKSTKVIVLTARGQDGDLLKIQAAGTDLILIKPVSLRILVEHIYSLSADDPARTLAEDKE